MADPTLILDIEPDWASDPAISYQFSTAVQATPYLIEQRRPLLQDVVRMANYKFTEKDEKSQRLLNNLLATKGERLVLPIFSEPILITSAVTGGVVIVASTTLTYLWNINNCDYVVLINMTTGESEMKKIASVSGQNIVLMTAILGTWIAAATVVYPAIAAALNSMKPTLVTDGVGSVEAEFVETVSGEESTEDWVGLDDRTCCESAQTAACDDYFNGSDYSSTDLFLLDTWTHVGNYPLVQDSKITFTNNYPSESYSTNEYYANFQFIGEFECYLTFTINAPDYGWLYLAANHDPSPDQSVYVTLWDTVDWQYDGSSSVPTSDLSGRIRLTRNASNQVYCYYWNNALLRWEWNGDTNGELLGVLAGAIYPSFGVQIWDQGSISVGDFIVTSGCDNIQPYTP